MVWRIKDWLIRLTEPWREEKASRDLERDMSPEGKVDMYEFNYGPDSKAEPIDPDFLVKQHTDHPPKKMVWRAGKGGRW